MGGDDRGRRTFGEVIILSSEPDNMGDDSSKEVRGRRERDKFVHSEV
jgi:hypothetical protein